MRALALRALAALALLAPAAAQAQAVQFVPWAQPAVPFDLDALPGAAAQERISGLDSSLMTFDATVSPTSVSAVHATSLGRFLSDGVTLDPTTGRGRNLSAAGTGSEPTFVAGKGLHFSTAQGLTLSPDNTASFQNRWAGGVMFVDGTTGTAAQTRVFAVNGADTTNTYVNARAPMFLFNKSTGKPEVDFRNSSSSRQAYNQVLGPAGGFSTTTAGYWLYRRRADGKACLSINGDPTSIATALAAETCTSSPFGTTNGDKTAAVQPAGSIGYDPADTVHPGAVDFTLVELDLGPEIISDAQLQLLDNLYARQAAVANGTTPPAALTVPAASMAIVATPAATTRAAFHDTGDDALYGACACRPLISGTSPTGYQWTYATALSVMYPDAASWTSTFTASLTAVYKDDTFQTTAGAMYSPSVDYNGNSFGFYTADQCSTGYDATLQRNYIKLNATYIGTAPHEYSHYCQITSTNRSGDGFSQQWGRVHVEFSFPGPPAIGRGGGDTYDYSFWRYGWNRYRNAGLNYPETDLFEIYPYECSLVGGFYKDFAIHATDHDHGSPYGRYLANGTDNAGGTKDAKNPIITCPATDSPWKTMGVVNGAYIANQAVHSWDTIDDPVRQISCSFLDGFLQNCAALTIRDHTPKNIMLGTAMTAVGTNHTYDDSWNVYAVTASTPEAWRTLP